jgi:hypothetical protein
MVSKSTFINIDFYGLEKYIQSSQYFINPYRFLSFYRLAPRYKEPTLSRLEGLYNERLESAIWRLDEIDDYCLASIDLLLLYLYSLPLEEGRW